MKDKIRTIQQKMESLKKLDVEIIDLMASCNYGDIQESIESEIDASDLVRTELNAIVDKKENALKLLSPPPSFQRQPMTTEGQNVYTGVHTPLTQSPHSSQPPGTTAKLPKLEVKMFGGSLQGKVCYEPRRPIRLALISGYCSMKRLGVFLLPPGWDASLSQGYPQH